MVKIDTYGEIYISDTLKNYLQAKNISICQFLYFADFSDISRHIEDKYYSDRNKHLRYPIESMLKLCIVKQFRELYDTSDIGVIRYGLAICNVCKRRTVQLKWGFGGVNWMTSADTQPKERKVFIV